MINWDTPYERLMENRPIYDHLRVIGCLCCASKTAKGDKFAEKGIKGILVGYLMLKRFRNCMLCRKDNSLLVET